MAGFRFVGMNCSDPRIALRSHLAHSRSAARIQVPHIRRPNPIAITFARPIDARERVHARATLCKLCAGACGPLWFRGERRIAIQGETP